ncbi:exo-alpha-sialidase [Trypanosoma cruzi]|nr:exo-alpha-sialidase [Trypanosoma cruzi]
MRGGRAFVAPQKAAIPPSPTPQHRAAVPHSLRSSSNNSTRDTHTRTVLSPSTLMDTNSVIFSKSKRSLSKDGAALNSDGISVSADAVLGFVGAVPTPSKTLTMR